MSSQSSTDNVPAMRRRKLPWKEDSPPSERKESRHSPSPYRQSIFSPTYGQPSHSRTSAMRRRKLPWKEDSPPSERKESRHSPSPYKQSIFSPTYGQPSHSRTSLPGESRESSGASETSKSPLPPQEKNLPPRTKETDCSHSQSQETEAMRRRKLPWKEDSLPSKRKESRHSPSPYRQSIFSPTYGQHSHSRTSLPGESRESSGASETSKSPLPPQEKNLPPRTKETDCSHSQSQETEAMKRRKLPWKKDSLPSERKESRHSPSPYRQSIFSPTYGQPSHSRTSLPGESRESSGASETSKSPLPPQEKNLPPRTKETDCSHSQSQETEDDSCEEGINDIFQDKASPLMTSDVGLLEKMKITIEEFHSFAHVLEQSKDIFITPEGAVMRERLLKEIKTREEMFEKYLCQFKQKKHWLLTDGSHILNDGAQAYLRTKYKTYLETLELRLIEMKNRRKALIKAFWYKNDNTQNHGSPNSSSSSNSTVSSIPTPIYPIPTPVSPIPISPINLREVRGKLAFPKSHTVNEITARSAIETKDKEGSSNSVLVPVSPTNQREVGGKPVCPEIDTVNDTINEVIARFSIKTKDKEGSSNSVLVPVSPTNQREVGGKPVCPEIDTVNDTINEVIPRFSIKTKDKEVSSNSVLVPVSPTNQREVGGKPVCPEIDTVNDTINEVIPRFSIKTKDKENWPRKFYKSMPKLDDLESDESEFVEPSCYSPPQSSSTHQDGSDEIRQALAAAIQEISSDDSDEEHSLVAKITIPGNPHYHFNIPLQPSQTLNKDLPGRSVAQECPDCQQCFGSIYLLYHHKVANHVPHSCNVCADVVANASSLWKHVETLHTSYVLCPECWTAVEKTNVSNHAKRHYHSANMTKVDHKFKCRVCNQVFKIMEDRKDHEKADHKNKFLVCRICGEIFITKYSLQKHSSSEHLADKTNVCKVCHIGFDDKPSLSRHLKLAHMMMKNTYAKQYDCIICQQFCFTPSDLVKHIRVFHQNDDVVDQASRGEQIGRPKYKCRHCTMHFKNLKVRAVHEIIYHETPPFVCACSKEFFSKGKLDEHFLKHSSLEGAAYKKCMVKKKL